MAIRPICIAGEPVLHRVADPVTQFDRDLKDLVSDMFETIESAPGVGLAAPQIGLGKRIFIWDYDEHDDAPERGVAINPELWITPLEPGSPDEDEAEGCLSFPGERFGLRRSSNAFMRAQNADGEYFEVTTSGWFARILQHEYDHLNGILYVDRLQYPEDRGAAKAKRKNKWGVPGLSWLPGRDHPEG
jgi:peptide deformylase